MEHTAYTRRTVCQQWVERGGVHCVCGAGRRLDSGGGAIGEEDVVGGCGVAVALGDELRDVASTCSGLGQEKGAIGGFTCATCSRMSA